MGSDSLGGEDRVLRVLLEEYKHHKDELRTQIELHHRQTQFGQLFAAFALGALAVLFRQGGTATPPLEAPLVLKAALLLWAAAFALFLSAATLSPSYMFRVLRSRLRALEAKINKRLGEDVMSYELVLVPQFLEKASYAPWLFTPHVIFGVSRAALLLITLTALAAAAWLFTPLWFFLSYLALIVPAGVFQLVQSLGVYRSRAFETIPAARRAETLDRHIDAAAGQPRVLDFAANRLQGGDIQGRLIRASLNLVTAGLLLALLRSIATAVPLADLAPLRELPTSAAFAVLTLYGLVCTAVPPLLTEAGLLLYPHVGLLWILGAAATGRVIGIMLLYPLGVALADMLRGLGLDWPIASARVERLVRRWGFSAYLGFQSIPLLPARSSALIYSSAGGSRGLLAVGAAIGTIIRHLIVLGMAWLTRVALWG